MSIKRLVTIIFSAIVVFSASYTPPSQAHDVDIYINNLAVTSGSVPMLMFSLDLRSNLGSNACTGTECDALIAGGYLPGAGPYKQIDVYRAAMKKVIQEEVVDKDLDLKIGLMVPHHNFGGTCSGPASTGCSNGGYIMFGFRSVKPAVDATGWTDFKAKLDQVPAIGGGNEHKYQPSEMFFEFFRYLTGQGVYNGHNGWRDYGTNATDNLNVDNAALSWDTTVETGGNYISPLTAACSKVYTINFLFGTINQDADSDAAMENTKANGGFGSPVSNNANARFTDVLTYLYNADLSDGTFNAAINHTSKHNVNSFFLVPSPSNTENTWARAGSGGNVNSATDLNATPDALVEALRNIVKSVLSVSTTFVAPSVSVNVYNRSQVLSDIFIAMFEAEQSGFPRWPGNIKKFRLGTNAGGDLEIQDVNGTNAVNGLDGRIKHNAISYWSITADMPAKTAADDFDNGTDGRTVKRGGAGSKIPGFKLKCDNTDNTTDTSCTPGDFTVGMTNPAGNTTNTSNRKVLYAPTTFTNGTAASLLPLNADIATATALQTPLGGTSIGSDDGGGGCDTNAVDTDATSACNLIKFARGLDDDNVTNRAWMTSDVLHSRPVAVNYGTYGGHTVTNPNIRLFAGSNDGTLRMIRNMTPGGAEDGTEGWAFMPRKVMGVNKLLKVNAITTPVTHPAGIDGSPVAWVDDKDGDGNIEPNGNDGSAATTADNDRVVLFFGLRRGGRAYYAMDVTNPDIPKLLWRIDNTSTGFSEMGQTWSTPAITSMVFGGTLPADVITPEPVIIIGGGYDPNKDDNSRGHAAAAGGDDSIGNAVFIIKALTGELVWKARFDATASTPAYDAANKAYERDDMKDSIPSRISIVDTDGNGLTDRIYVGDTGGVVWRGNFKSNNEANWVFIPILNIGRHITGATAADDRRFFSPPDYVQTKDASGVPFDALLIGSGDRANPLGNTVVEWFYMVKDYDTPRRPLGTYHNNPKTPTGTYGLGDVSNNCLQDDPNNAGCTPDLSYGWKMKLECPPDYPAVPGSCGEKNLSSAITLGGTVFFSTFRPALVAAANCIPKEGSGLLYAVALQDATAVQFNKGGTKKEDRYDTIASGGIPSSPVAIGGGKLIDSGLRIRTTKTPPGIKTYWYEKYFK